MPGCGAWTNGFKHSQRGGQLERGGRYGNCGSWKDAKRIYCCGCF